MRARTVLTMTLGITLAAVTVLATVAPASASGLAFTFPVVGRTGDAVIQHVGGLSLTAGSTVVTLSNFRIDTSTGVVSGVVDDTVRVPLFTLGGATTSGLALKLTGIAATYLNGAFGVPTFSEGLVIGYGAPAEIA